MRNKLRSLLIFIGFIILMLALFWWRFLVMPIIPASGVHFYFEQGETAIRFAHKLKNQAPGVNAELFSWYIELRGDAHHLKAGEYQFKPYSRPSQVVDQVTKGSDIYHSFIIVNGWNIYDVMRELENDQYIKHDLRGKNLTEVAHAIGIKQNSPEGWLFPNTYYFRWGTTDVQLLKRAYTAMQEYLNKAWRKRAANLPYKDPYQVLIVASMIEKETALDNEKPMVAGVILKRLKMWMHLQIDASVIYGLEPNFKGPLTKADLALKTPFNTYTKYGLPPTPIAMPGPYAIDAALNPKISDYLYYVAKGDGSHVFSKTLAEHNAAVRKYILKQSN